MNPWYLRAMMGLAGAMAALFFLAFIAMGMSFVLESRAAGLVAGAALICAAWILLRVGRADFSVMFALAISLAGQGLLAYVLFDSFDLWSSAWPWVALCLLGAGLVAAMPHFLHRLAAALLAGLALGGGARLAAAAR